LNISDISITDPNAGGCVLTTGAAGGCVLTTGAAGGCVLTSYLALLYH